MIRKKGKQHNYDLPQMIRKKGKQHNYDLSYITAYKSNYLGQNLQL